jgi:hypothetical protein
MRKNDVLKLLCLSLFVWLFIPFSNARAKDAATLVGQEASFFTLPSTQDRTASYLNDYYGKYHLIMTFFPAAFTPV